MGIEEGFMDHLDTSDLSPPPLPSLEYFFLTTVQIKWYTATPPPNSYAEVLHNSECELIWVSFVVCLFGLTVGYVGS